ncbi:uncharacterized protein K452DRAFT_290716 [Aplosporella prunicola CBS 121167]|uniref:Uncharacterized protein n=1 Tax=Aplosporella prunicola CBS 121167 TaxID=1176127 RepID=A0A6A6B5Q4_9PEZI|nr:uncharacterized protein K452DRAFT_290716 [Aplosporella prunicola CBS 121167]KAF2138574.1 hypothetical protein K452DRAFT_290716 [Aplosporella prunicola CBS 121167]
MRRRRRAALLFRCCPPATPSYIPNLCTTQKAAADAACTPLPLLFSSAHPQPGAKT